MNTTDVLTKFLTLRRELSLILLERETAIEAALLALLTGEHLLLLCPPGTAKSLMVRSICERIAGAVCFERLLTRFSTPEEIFGPLSLSALENDQYRRFTAGTLIDAHLGFIDECYKANSSILNSLLGIMNERIYHEAGQTISLPLLLLMGASNETPEDDSLAALHDRFLLRITVPYLASDDSLRWISPDQDTSLRSRTPGTQRKALLENAGRLAEKRTTAIVSAKHSRAYRRAAQVIVAWAEATTIIGDPMAGKTLIERLRRDFPRHRNFKREIDEAIESSSVLKAGGR